MVQRKSICGTLRYNSKKISFDNRLLWEKKYGGTADEYVIQISSSANKNWNLLGYSSSFGLTKPSAWLFQVDAQTGAMVWQVVYSNLRYGTSGVTYPRSLYEKSVDAYYIAGSVADYYVTTSSAFIAKLRPAGQTSWEYTFDNAKYGRRAGVKIFVYGRDIYLFSIKTGPTPNSPSGIVFTKIQEI